MLRGIMFLLAAVFLQAISALQPALAQSFDCRKARTADERAICADPLLGELDEIMANFYRHLRRYTLAFDNAMGLQGQLVREARTFLRRRVACRGNVICIERAYRARILQLLSHWRTAMEHERAPHAPAVFTCRQPDLPVHAWHRRACPDTPDDMKLVETWRLGGGRVACAMPCWMAAYNIGVRVHEVNPATGEVVRTLRFPMVDGASLKRREEIVSPSFDAASKMVKSFERGRGLGDCGVQYTWRWNGTRFRLLKQREKDACDGRRGPWRQVWPR